MSDDGIGVRVVQLLAERYRYPAGVTILDGGTLGLDLLPRLEGVERLLVVDAVHQVVRMRDEEVEAPPALLGGGAEAEFIEGIGRPRPDRMLILLGLDAVLTFSVRVRR